MELDETKISLYFKNWKRKKWKKGNCFCISGFSPVLHSLLKTRTRKPAGFIPGGEEATCVSDVCVRCKDFSSKLKKKDC